MRATACSLCQLQRKFHSQIKSTKPCHGTVQVAQNRVNKECNELVNEGNRLQRELGAQTTSCSRLASENQIRGAALKSAEAALAAAKTENARLARGLDSATAMLRLAEEKRTQQEQARDELR